MGSPSELPVYLLLGGQSKRFGTDKATYPIDGKPWALDTGERLASTGKLSASTLFFVGREQPTHAALQSIPFIQDAEPAVGVLSGVVAAVRHCLATNGQGLLVIASCDLVQPNPEWLAPLREAHQKDATLEVAAYFAADRWQPFPSVVHTRWLERLEAHLASPDDHSLQSLYRQSNSIAIPWDGPPEGPPQANTPEALRALLGI